MNLICLGMARGYFSRCPLVLDDWRLDENGQIHLTSIGSIGERAHGGRFGNTFTCNGFADYHVPVKAGERVRFRFCNVAADFAVSRKGSFVEQAC